MLRSVVAVVALLCSQLPAQLEFHRYAPATDFSPMAPAVVAYEPQNGFGCFIGRTATSGASFEVWRFEAGAWLRLPTASSVSVSFDPAAATWPGNGVLLVAAGASWLFDGVDFALLPAANTPPRLDAMAFDAARGRMVGWRADAAQPQTWEFDGATWQPFVPATVPPSGDARMAWHEGLQRVVLQSTNSVARAMFSWDGVDWVNHYWRMGSPMGFSLAAAPGASVLASGGSDHTFFAGPSEVWDGSAAQPNDLGSLPGVPSGLLDSVSWFDPVLQRTVVTSLGGGMTSWYWDGASWSFSEVGEQPGDDDNIAYDSWRGEALTFGGMRAPQYEHGELWARRGTQWQRVGTAPFAPRRFANIAFDSWRGRLVMFGGGDHDGGAGATYSTIPTGTYEWDGSQWFDVTPPGAAYPNHPRSLQKAGMAFDRARGRVVVFGGTFRVPGWTLASNETWEWDGAAWARRSPVTVPPGGAGVRLAFDEPSGKCWLRAGGDLWSWDGVDWTLAGPFPAVGAPAPIAQEVLAVLSYQAATFDLARGMVVGIDATSTFEFGDPQGARLRPFGLACQGSVGAVVLHAEQLPRLGATLPLRIEALPVPGASVGLLGSDTDTFAGLLLPIDLSPLGMTGCTLHTAIDATDAVFGPGWSIPIPAGAASLVGATFRVQVVVVDPAANAAGLVTSNPVLLRVGA